MSTLSCHQDPFQAFVRDLAIEGCEVHLYKGPNAFGLSFYNTMPALPEWWDTENTYFLAGVIPHLTKRAADTDVLKRNMFTLDFDIRKEMEKHREAPVVPDYIKDLIVEIPPEEVLVRVANEIMEKLLAHPVWRNFRYVVLSGNGMHVHYFGEPVDVKKEEWAAGMKGMFNEVNSLTPMPCDTGCGNAGRIMRMPGSWNVKGERKPVEFLAWNEGAVFPLGTVQALGQELIREHEEKKAQERAEFEASGKEGSDVIALINQIPIEQVVKQLPLGITAHVEKKDGGLRFRDDKNVERGFFKHHKYNVVVHEGTSLFPAPSGVGYNCLGLVKTVLGIATPDAIKWFCERSPAVRAAEEKEKAEWAAQQAPKEISFIDDLLPKNT